MRRFSNTDIHTLGRLAILIMVIGSPALAQDPPPIKERNVRAHEEFLAGDALNGRGSATRDEWIAATYIGSQFRQFGIEPAGDLGFDGKPGYVQTVSINQQTLTAPPTFSAGTNTWSHGKDIAVLRMGSANTTGKLQKLTAGATVEKGAVVYIHLSEDASPAAVRTEMNAPSLGATLISLRTGLGQRGATMVVIADAKPIRQRFEDAASALPEMPMSMGSKAETAALPSVVILNDKATKQFDALADGTIVTLVGDVKVAKAATYNAIGILPGSAPKLANDVILLTAHLDHLGFRENKTDDSIYNGANDDASGVTAVLELARALGSSSTPGRTVYFVCFGSEERGMFGARYFLDHPPVPLEDIVANLEFEVIGVPDNKVGNDMLWLTGWERSNLGTELAKQGALLVADPRPEEDFFMRSDNIRLARRGVVAQTVSSGGQFPQLHRPDDDLTHIDFAHMTAAINSLVKPVFWLVNSDFKPQWKPGGKP